MADKTIIFERNGHQQHVVVPDDATDAEIASLYAEMFPEVTASKAEISRAKVLPPGGPVPGIVFRATEGMPEPSRPKVATVAAAEPEGLPEESGLVGFRTGLLTGPLSTLTGIAAMLGSERAKDIHDALKPTSPSQKVGRFIEQAAEFALPAAKVGSIGKGAGALNVAKRAAAQGVTAGAVAAAQNGDVSEGVAPAVVSAALPVAGAALSTTAKRIMGSAMKGGVKNAAARLTGQNADNLTLGDIERVSDDLIDAGFRLPSGVNAQTLSKARGQEFENLLSRFRDSSLGPWKPYVKTSLKPQVIDKVKTAFMKGEITSQQAEETLQRAAGLSYDSVITALKKDGAIPYLPPDIKLEAARILAERGPQPLNLGELGMIGGGVSYLLGPKVGVPLTALRAAASHYPQQTAKALAATSRRLSSPVTTGLAAEGADGMFNDSEALAALEAELLKRSSR